MQTFLYLLILLLGIATYTAAVWQMVRGDYSPSFFSRGVWFLLGIVSFAGVLFGGGSDASIVLAGTLFAGNATVFAVSYRKGSREFGTAEKISLVLLAVSGLAWVLLQAPFLSLVISLVAHFVGGIPTIWRVAKHPHTEQAYHWYFFFPACVLSVIASDKGHIKAVLFPLYFAIFDGIIIVLANRQRITKVISRGGS